MHNSELDFDQLNFESYATIKMSNLFTYFCDRNNSLKLKVN